MVDLGTLPGDLYSYGSGINDSGEVAGISCTAGNTICHAFLYNGTSMTDLGTLPGDTSSAAYSINASGEVTGLSGTSSGEDAILYNGTSMVNLGTLGGTDAAGTAINDIGEVVGVSLTTGDASQHAFLYDAGVMYDLNSLISPTDPLYGKVDFSYSTGINDSGQIVANGGYTSGPLNGQSHAFRLDPVRVFAGTPGKANCHGQSVSALAQQYGGLNAAVAALGYSDVSALQNAIVVFCED